MQATTYLFLATKRVKKQELLASIWLTVRGLPSRQPRVIDFPGSLFPTNLDLGTIYFDGPTQHG